MQQTDANVNGDSSRASDTSPVEITKKGIRLNIWKQVRKNQSSGRVPYFAYNRIPWFSGDDDPVIKLKDLEIFKNAKHVLVGYDKAQESVKLACLQAGKTLYVQVPRLLKSLMTCLNLPEDATPEVMLEALNLKGLEQYGKPIGLEDQVPLDLIIIGSIAVSKDGIRIGRGGGFVDLYLAILSHLKMIQPTTKFVTTVHDSQLLDSIPSNIIGPYDYPVDMIITPTQVIECQREKPTGIIWNLINSRQLKTNQLVAKIRDKEIEAGNECTLKSIDSDMDNGIERQTRRFYHRARWGNNRRWTGPGRYRKQLPNGVHSESEQYEGGEGEAGNANGKPERHRRPYIYRRRKVNPQLDSAKKAFRDKAWYTLRINHVSTTPRHPYFRIPGFKGVQEATQLFRDLDMYKNAKTVLVSIDKLYEGVRKACLEDGKNLFVLNPKSEKELLIRVNQPDSENKLELESLVNISGLQEHGVKVEPDNSINVDLWVIGSVAVSKDGNHIGKGNGSIDLLYAFLNEKNVINSDTKISTLVHNCQVFDTLPEDLFADYDIPVDTIITPTEVIETNKERKPSQGIVWNLINQQYLSRIPYLVNFREKEIEDGKPCILKEVEKRLPRSNEHSESEQNDLTEGESGDQGRKRRGPPRAMRRFQRKSKDNGDNDESGNISPDTTSMRPKRRYQYRRPKYPLDFSVRVSSIDRLARVRDLKAALNERNVKPSMITWKGNKGYCYLHFAKNMLPSNTETETEWTSDSILIALANLTLQPTADDENSKTPPGPNKLSVELTKPRIETANKTAV